MLFDELGNQTGLIDPVGNRTTWSFDALNRKTAKIDPANETATYAFDAAGRMTSTTDRIGRRRDFSYDELHRKTQEVWIESGSPVNTLSYDFDEVGNLLTATDADGTITMGYDALNRMTTTKDMWNALVTLSFDAAGNVTKVQDSFGGTITSTYDAIRRLTKREFDDGSDPLRIDLGYTVRDELQTLTRYSDLAGSSKVGSTTYGYDDIGRTTRIKHLDAIDAVFADYQYSFDAASRMLTQKIDSDPTTTFTHDGTNQLTGATGGRSESYDYDLNGNRDSAGYSTGSGNRLTSDGVWTYTYDKEGNIVKKSKGASDETWFLDYDHLNHLTSAELRATDNPSGTLLYREENDFDVFGNRIEVRIDSDGDTNWDTIFRPVYIGHMFWADLDDNNDLLTRYIFGDRIDQFFARITAGTPDTPAWYLTDHVGSVTDIVDDTGAVINHTEYDSFGIITLETGTAYGDRIKYTSREWSEGQQRYYYRARWYNPNTGRFDGEDPAADDPKNLFRYVGNNPLMLTDPMGREAIVIDPSDPNSPSDFIGNPLHGDGGLSDYFSRPPNAELGGPGFGLEKLAERTLFEWLDDIASWVEKYAGLFVQAPVVDGVEELLDEYLKPPIDPNLFHPGFIPLPHDVGAAFPGNLNELPKFDGRIAGQDYPRSYGEALTFAEDYAFNQSHIDLRGHGTIIKIIPFPFAPRVRRIQYEDDVEYVEEDNPYHTHENGFYKFRYSIKRYQDFSTGRKEEIETGTAFVPTLGDKIKLVPHARPRDVGTVYLCQRPVYLADGKIPTLLPHAYICVKYKDGTFETYSFDCAVWHKKDELDRRWRGEAAWVFDTKLVPELTGDDIREAYEIRQKVDNYNKLIDCQNAAGNLLEEAHRIRRAKSESMTRPKTHR